jgi:hypothetical protein
MKPLTVTSRENLYFIDNEWFVNPHPGVWQLARDTLGLGIPESIPAPEERINGMPPIIVFD